MKFTAICDRVRYKLGHRIRLVTLPPFSLPFCLKNSIFLPEGIGKYCRQGWAIAVIGIFGFIISPVAAQIESEQEPSLTSPQDAEPVLPPPEELLPPSLPPIEPRTFVIDRFNIVGSTILDSQTLTEITAPFTNRPLTLQELQRVTEAITRYYIERGYTTSTARLNREAIADGEVTIFVIEGSIEDIFVEVDGDLSPDYVRDRLALATETPLNTNRLTNALMLLLLDPRIENLNAQLADTAIVGQNILNIKATAAKTFQLQASFANAQVPSVGTDRRRLRFEELNLTGVGDRIIANYSNSDGSDAFDLVYIRPLNHRDGELILAYGFAFSEIIEEPFTAIDIQSDGEIYELVYRQPIKKTPREEIVLSVAVSRQISESILLGNPFPIARGADEQGRTRISTLRLGQEWTRRGDGEISSVRSLFSIGIDVLGTSEDEIADSQFLTWRMTGQWARRLSPNAVLLIRGELQLADDSLPFLEQYQIGGVDSVRGYRQSAVLADNGALTSVEARLPIMGSFARQNLLSVTPFIDAGVVWNQGDIEIAGTNLLIGFGLGLLWERRDFRGHIQWGIPLTEGASADRTLQEAGIYFAIEYNLF